MSGCGGSYAAYVGLDVHKDTIAVAVAPAGRGAPEDLGEIANRPAAVARLARELCAAHGGEMPLFSYEAGPCGYGLYRQLRGLGFDCEVVAPSRIPRAPAERVKTDRRDARKLARLSRGGELTAVWVPDEDHEAMRDLVRARSDLKDAERRARQRLGAFLLRHDRRWSAGRWSRAHWAWLDGQRFERDWQEWAYREYLEAARTAGERVAALTGQLERALSDWSLAPVARALVALRGVDRITAATLLAELGDIGRFDSPRQLMAFLGLVPSEHSSGGRRRRGARWWSRPGATGSRHVARRIWNARRPARPQRPGPSPGAPSGACAVATATCSRPARTRSRRPWPWRASWPASCGTSSASRWRGWRRPARRRRRRVDARLKEGSSFRVLDRAGPGRCGEPSAGLRRRRRMVRNADPPARRPPPLERGQLRDAVR